jgi:hypothetical protein
MIEYMFKQIGYLESSPDKYLFIHITYSLGSIPSIVVY